MDVFEADYSNLFAAGLRGIQSRSTDPDRSSSKSQLQPAIGSDQGVERVEGPNVPSSVWKSFLPSTRSWRRPPRLPQSVKTPSVVRNLTSWSGFVSKSARRDSIPSNILEESSLKLRILDWSLHVSNAVDTLGCVLLFFFSHHRSHSNQLGEPFIVIVRTMRMMNAWIITHLKKLTPSTCRHRLRGRFFSQCPPRLPWGSGRSPPHWSSTVIACPYQRSPCT